MKPKEWNKRSILVISQGRKERDQYFEDFKGKSKSALEEERKFIIESIQILESISPTRLDPEERNKMLDERWRRRREVEAQIKMSI